MTVNESFRQAGSRAEPGRAAGTENGRNGKRPKETQRRKNPAPPSSIAENGGAGYFIRRITRRGSGSDCELRTAHSETGHPPRLVQRTAATLTVSVRSRMQRKHPPPLSPCSCGLCRYTLPLRSRARVRSPRTSVRKGRTWHSLVPYSWLQMIIGSQDDPQNECQSAPPNPKPQSVRSNDPIVSAASAAGEERLSHKLFHPAGNCLFGKTPARQHP